MSGKGKGKRSRPQPAEENGHDAKTSGDKRTKYQNGNGGGGSNKNVALKLSGKLLEGDMLTKLRDSWRSTSCKSPDDAADTKVIKEPFTCCSLADFATPSNSVDELVQELQDLEFAEKNNDLYKFKQSGDLKSVNSPAVVALRQFLAEDVKSWLHEVTGIDFLPTIDIFCARYDYTDYLLCHDDELEGRRIAYIWYLVPPSWCPRDGGTLDLFDRDEHGQPNSVVKSLLPSMNSFVFFEVTPASFHQVSEVLTRDKTRLSIGGWFHAAKGPDRPPKHIEPKPELESPQDIDEDDFFAWINPLYLDPLNQVEIQENFEANSEICLKDFLAEEKYEEICSALQGEELNWSLRGPANLRRYEVLGDDSAPDVVQQCVKFLKSDAMFLLLSNLTCLNLHHLGPSGDGEGESSSENDEDATDDVAAVKDKSPQASSSSGSKQKDDANGGKHKSDPKCRSEIRRWKQGSYTLIRDDDQGQTEFALDARLFLNCKGWSIDCGGYSSYVARDEDEELLSAQPEENCLVLVYRDADTLAFVKRVTDEIGHRLPRKEFNDISVVYYE